MSITCYWNELSVAYYYFLSSLIPTQLAEAVSWWIDSPDIRDCDITAGFDYALCNLLEKGKSVGVGSWLDDVYSVKDDTVIGSLLRLFI